MSEKNTENVNENLFLETLPAIIYTCKDQEDFAVTSYISQNVELETGYQSGHITSTPSFWSDHIHPDDKKKVFSGLEEWLKKGFQEVQYRFKISDGSYKWLNDLIHLIKQPEGSSEYRTRVWKDLLKQETLKKEFLNIQVQLKGAIEDLESHVTSRITDLQMKQAIFSGIIGISDKAIISVDKDHRMIIFNAGAEAIFGYKASDIFGKPGPLEKPPQ